MGFAGCPLSRSLLEAKRTSFVALHMSAPDPKRTWPTAQRIGLKAYPAPSSGSSPYDGFVPGLGVGNQKARVHCVCWRLGDDAMANGKLNWETSQI